MRPRRRQWARRRCGAPSAAPCRCISVLVEDAAATAGAIVDTRSLLQTLYETYGQDRLQGEQDRALWQTLGSKLQAYEQLSKQIETLAQSEEAPAEGADAAPSTIAPQLEKSRCRA